MLSRRGKNEWERNLKIKRGKNDEENVCVSQKEAVGGKLKRQRTTGDAKTKFKN